MQKQSLLVILRDEVLGLVAYGGISMTPWLKGLKRCLGFEVKHNKKTHVFFRLEVGNGFG